jgi:trans-aconitate 2-methyltransferase
MRDVWDTAQYERFHDERSRPFHDLLALVQPRDAMRVVDLGCGTGELTALLHARLGARETLGIDRSDAMLAAARSRAAAGLRFEQADILDVPPGPYDLVFSNAALQWLPAHAALFRRLTTEVAAGGQLAIQMPSNHDHPSHTVAAEVAHEEPFRSALGEHAGGQPGVLAPEAYAAILDGLGYRAQDVRLKVYPHRLAARDEVVEWVRGTLLTAYERWLPAELYPRFVERYRARVLPRLDDRTPYLFTFKRLLIWAQR